MTTRRITFPFRSWSLATATWFTVVPAGWALIGVGVYQLATAHHVAFPASLIMCAGLLFLLELLPLVQGRGHDPQGVVTSTAFVCGIMFVWGLWPAIAMVSVASICSDIRHGKNWWQPVFNAAQYTLSVAAAFAVTWAAGQEPSLAHPLRELRIADIAWMAPALIAYFVTNLVLVGCVLSFSGRFRRNVLDDFGHYATMTFSVLALSPLIVALAQTSWGLLPLPVIPLLLLYYTAQMSLLREHEASHDALTGLANRSTLQLTLGESFTRYEQEGEPFGLLLADVDDFKRVNDTLGHQVGDELLVRLAARLSALARPDDEVARLGGDEFAIVVGDADAATVLAEAERIRAAMAEPIGLGGLNLGVELSIGIALCPEHGSEGNTLLQRADVAMYIAKEHRSGIECYASDRDVNSPDRLGLLDELRHAIEDDALELVYQPKISTRNESATGVEALLRWNHPIRGQIQPDTFVPLAEQSGIMPLLTKHVIDMALRQMASWRDHGLLVPTAVNIAPSDLQGDQLIHTIRRGLRRYELPASLLQLEITERIVARRPSDSIDMLGQLRELGVTISLDDFGTGYSSLMRLHRMPVDELKIDRVFVSAMAADKQAIGIVKALIELAHALDLPAVAEGVDTDGEWRLLQQLGCDAVQGWYVARPMPGEQIASWIRARQPARRLARVAIEPRDGA